MAANLVKRPVSRIIQKRFYSAHGYAKAHQDTAARLLPKDIQVGKASNGILIAAQENYSPLAQIVAVVKAGARFEKSSQLGVSHCIRAASDQATKQYTAFALSRTLQQLGGILTVTDTRENLIYSLQVIRDNAEEAAGYLAAAATQQAFQPWEISDIQARLKLDIAQLQERPDIRVVERLHEVAYRNQAAGLGRSLFAPPHQVGKFTSEGLHGYVSENFGVSNIALYGQGIEYAQLEAIARSFVPAVGSGADSEAKSKYFGGEYREHNDSWLTHVLLAAEGASLAGKDVYTYGVLQHLLGAGPYIKWPSQSGVSGLTKAAAQATDRPFHVAAFNFNYTDSGLFGVQLVTQGSETGKVLKSVMKEVVALSKSITEADLKRAKTQLKASLLYQAESGTGLSEARAVELLQSGGVSAQEGALKDVDAVAISDVQNALKKLVGAKLAMAAIGDLHATPYVDQISA